MQPDNTCWIAIGLLAVYFWANRLAEEEPLCEFHIHAPSSWISLRGRGRRQGIATSLLQFCGRDFSPEGKGALSHGCHQENDCWVRCTWGTTQLPLSIIWATSRQQAIAILLLLIVLLSLVIRIAPIIFVSTIFLTRVRLTHHRCSS